MSTVVGARLIGQLSSYPLINDTYSQTMNCYDRVKNYSPYLATPLNLAESGVKTAVNTSQPIIKKFEGPLTKAEDMACNGLTLIETRYPVVLKPTEELIEDSKEYYQTNMQPVVQKAASPITYTYDTVVNYSHKTVESLNQTTVAKKSYTLMEQLVDAADDYADKYLPSDSENTAEDKERKNLLDKTFFLKNKVQRRMYSKAMKGLREMKHRSDDSLKKLHFTVDLMEYAKTQMSETKSKVGDIYQEISERYTEEKQEESNQKNSDTVDVTSDESLLLQKTRVYANNIRLTVLATSTVFYNHVSEENQMRLAKAKQFSEDIYHQLINSKKVTDLSDAFYLTSRRSLEYVQSTLDSIFKCAMELKEHYVRKYSSKKPIQHSESTESSSSNDEEAEMNE